ncbi:hypothetical protein ACFLU3_02110 [Chloroflexota bacterium]
MDEVWVELRYGPGPGISLCRMSHPYLLMVFKQCAIAKAQERVAESLGVDEVIHYQDRAELERLDNILSLVIPDEED